MAGLRDGRGLLSECSWAGEERGAGIMGAGCNGVRSRGPFSLPALQQGWALP